MEQKDRRVKAEKAHGNNSLRREGENWIKQDRGMEKRNLNRSWDKR